MSGLFACFGSVATFRRGLLGVAERGTAGRVEIEVEGGWIGAAVDEGGDVGVHGPFTVALDGRPTNLRALTAEQIARESGATTPAEVIGAIFEEIGVEQGLSRMEGSFALLAWDAERNTLWAVRDRLGARPMFWRPGVGAGSSPGALGTARGTDALDRLTRVGLIPPPLSVIDGVERIAAGCLARIVAPGGDHRGSGVLRWWDAPGLTPGRGGALIRWVQSLEFAARMCIRQAGPNGTAVWVEDDASRAVLAAAAHPVDGKVAAIVVEIEGVGGTELSDALEVHRAPLGPKDLERAIEDLGQAEEPTADPDALLWWAVGRRAEALGLTRVLSGRGGEAWLEPAPAGLVARLRASRAQPETCPEVEVITATSPVRPPSASWLYRRLALPERTLRTPDLVGTTLGVRFALPLCDPRLVQLGASVPVLHHPGIATALWANLGVPLHMQGAKRAQVPLSAWLRGPCKGLWEGLDARLAAVVEPASVRALTGAVAASEAAAIRVFALLVVERWLHYRGGESRTG